MNKKQKNRCIAIVTILILLGLAAGLVLYALKQNINLFFTPTQLHETIIQPNQALRIGGYVKKKSVIYDKSGQSVSFVITDNKNDLNIEYHGVLPNLFREGQGVVVTGKLTEKNMFQADQVLAKHDEKYIPWSLKKELKEEKYVR